MLKLLRLLFGDSNKAGQARPRLNFPGGIFSEIFAIGDVHGCLAELLDAERRILARTDLNDGRKLIVLLGDYVDRGLDSSGVIDHLVGPPPAGFERICLCGNHDDAFLNFVTGPKFEREWLDFGGDATLRSYGVDALHHLKADPRGRSMLEAAQDHVPADHLDFLRQAPVALSVGKFVFVHAGLRPGVPLDRQTEADMLWIREPFLTDGPLEDVIVVHGHTPAENIVFGNRRIGVDVGAYMTGRLQVLRINADGYEVL